MKLNKKDFGLLLDFFGAQRDLKDKVIRVLHDLSFVEDPTRAFRAIRFSERFGFKLTKHTENLIKLALRMNIFEKLSGSRLYDELILTFSETDPIKALKGSAISGCSRLFMAVCLFRLNLKHFSSPFMTPYHGSTCFSWMSAMTRAGCIWQRFSIS